MSDHFQRVRERAYCIWEETGRLEGLEMEHWLIAEREIGEQIGGETNDNNLRDGRSGDLDEGNLEGAKNYNRHLKEFGDTGEIGRKADEAAEALKGKEGESLRQAEIKGKQRARS